VRPPNRPWRSAASPRASATSGHSTALGAAVLVRAWATSSGRGAVPCRAVPHRLGPADPGLRRPALDPAAAVGALLVVLVAGAQRLAGRRDVGAGLLPPRRGPAGACALLSGPTGLLTRVQGSTVAGWAMAMLLPGLTFGSLTDSVSGRLAATPGWPAPSPRTARARPTPSPPRPRCTTGCAPRPAPSARSCGCAGRTSPAGWSCSCQPAPTAGACWPPDWRWPPPPRPCC
jgi:hypothetical protein